MSLSLKQQGVLLGMIIGFVIALSVILVGIFYDPFALHRSGTVLTRLHVLAFASVLPTFTLMLCIGRLAKYRFFHAEDIDGGGLTSGSAQAKILQSLLQNTLEQWVLAISVYFMWCIFMPAKWLSTIMLCSVLFFIGRIVFFVGYKKGAEHRAIGFTVCFYASSLLWFIFLVFQLSFPWHA
ncbi:MAG: MAPEG family protein [Cellvibrionales bacterium]|nr:MAPEG family protein [Cellvibrionales bacterium]